MCTYCLDFALLYNYINYVHITLKCMYCRKIKKIKAKHCLNILRSLCLGLETLGNFQLSSATSDECWGNSFIYQIYP